MARRTSHGKLKTSHFITVSQFAEIPFFINISPLTGNEDGNHLCIRYDNKIRQLFHLVFYLQ